MQKQIRSKAYLPPAYVVRREGNVLTRVCPSIHVCPQGGDTPARSRWGVPQPGPDRGVRRPGPDEGYPSQVQLGEYPQPSPDGGGVPQPGLDRGVPWPGPDGGTQGGVPPVRTTEGVLAMRRAVRLLRLRRRTVLFQMFICHCRDQS